MFLCSRIILGRRAALALALSWGALWFPLPGRSQSLDPRFIDQGPKKKAEIRAQNQTLLPAPEPTAQAVIMLRPGVNAQDFARRYRVQVVHPLKSVANAFLFRAASPLVAQMLVSAARQDPQVQKAFVQQRVHKELMAFLPNDPYYVALGGLPGQWHLENSLTPGRDVRIRGAWNRNLTGAGVTIGIVDDSLQWTHPDLAPNYSANDSFDFGEDDFDPSPVWSWDGHGVAVAGVAAARGGNGVGVSGAAPFATLAGLRIDFAASTNDMFVDATLYQSNYPGAPINIKNHSYGYAFSFIDDKEAYDAITETIPFGTIHVFSAGNGRNDFFPFLNADSNKRMTSSHPSVITVAAFGSNGTYADYSNFGANVFVTAPSSSSGAFSILTTDRTGADGYNAGGGGSDPFPDGDYTSQFGGTSSAAPLVAGILALGKQAQPALDARFAKHLLAQTSRIVDLNDSTETSDGGWKTNAANFKFNPNYGFGLINADAFTQMATEFTGVTAPFKEGVVPIVVMQTIPDNNMAGVTRYFNIRSSAPMETLRVYLNIEHSWRGDLEAIVTSPKGTKSRLFSPSFFDFDFDIDWVFTSNAFWGENPQGAWSITLRDRFEFDIGIWWVMWAEAQMGRLIAVPELTSLTPNTAPEDAPELLLTANGKKFTPASYITWNGVALPTKFMSASKLQAKTLTAGLTGPNPAEVKVVTPDPGGTSASLSFRLGQSSTTILVSNVSGRTGQSVQLRGALRRIPDGVFISGKTLTFKVDGATVGTAVIGSDNQARLDYVISSHFTPGVKTVGVEFAGDSGYVASSGSGALTVTTVNDTLLTIANVAGRRGQTLLLRGALRRYPDGAAVAGKTLTFKLDGVTLGTAVTGANGVAQISYLVPNDATYGAHTLTVEFAGDADYNPTTKQNVLGVNP